MELLGNVILDGFFLIVYKSYLRFIVLLIVYQPVIYKYEIWVVNMIRQQTLVIK